MRENKNTERLSMHTHIHTHARTHARKRAPFPLPVGRTGAAAAARAVVIPFGQRAPSTMLGSHLRTFCTFVVLPSPNTIIFAKRGESTNEYKQITNTSGKRHPKRHKRIQTEYTRVQTSTDELQKPEGNDITGGTDEYKRISQRRP